MDAPTFKGVNLIKVDDKGRMAMPSKHRQVLQTYCEGRLVVTAFQDKCLLLYPSRQWPAIETQLLELPNASGEVRDMHRVMLGYATECTMDSNGRFLLSLMSRDFACIDRQAVLLGQGNKFELWGNRVWEEKLRSLSKTQNDTKDVHEVLEKIRL